MTSKFVKPLTGSFFAWKGGMRGRGAVMAMEGFPSTVKNASYRHHIHRQVWCFVQLYFFVYSKILAIISCCGPNILLKSRSQHLYILFP